MSYFETNDIVICKMKDGWPVHKDSTDYETKLTFKILGKCWDDYVIYIPCYEVSAFERTITITNKICDDFTVDRKFLGEQMSYLRESNIYGIERKASGAKCKRCGDFWEWADKEQEFTCRSCVENPWR